MRINYDALAEARSEYEEALHCEERIRMLKSRARGHKRAAVQLYKDAGITSADIRRIMLLGED